MLHHKNCWPRILGSVFVQLYASQYSDRILKDQNENFSTVNYAVFTDFTSHIWMMNALVCILHIGILTIYEYYCRSLENFLAWLGLLLIQKQFCTETGFIYY